MWCKYIINKNFITMENNKKITKQLVMLNITNSVKILKEIVHNRGYNTTLYMSNGYEQIINDMIYSLRDLRYSLQGYKTCINRSKQDKAYSINEIVAKIKSICKNSCNKQFREATYSVIDLLQPICEYCNSNTASMHSTLIAQCLMSRNITDMQKSILLVSLKDLNSAKEYMNNAISGKTSGVKLLSSYDNCNNANGDLLTISTIKNKIDSVLRSIDSAIQYITSAQRCIIEELNKNSYTELSEYDELY